MPRGGEARQGRLLRGGGLPPADDRGRAHEGGAPRDPRPRGPGGGSRLRGPEPLRGARAVPGHGRCRPRLRRPRRASPCRRRPPGDGERPPRPDPPSLAGGARRRRGARVRPALRRADGLRRTARRLLRDEGGAQAAPAGADRGRVEGRRGPARLPAVAPDPRAAHPPRQGDEQHLHGAGAAGHHGRDVRGVPRPGGPAKDREARPRARPRAPAGPAEAGLRRGQRALLRHPARADLSGEGPGDRGTGPGEGDQPAPRTRTARSGSPSTRPPCPGRSSPCSRPSRVGRSASLRSSWPTRSRWRCPPPTRGRTRS